MEELKLIQKFKKLRQDKSVYIGPGDDAAVIKSGKKYLLFCGDMFIEDVHFTIKKCKFEDIGYRAVARTLSDVAAMAGRPKYIGVSLALPRKYSKKALSILKGIREISEKFKLSIVGGDMSRARKIFLDVWCLGYAEKNRITTRSGAKDADGIFTSGKLGCSLNGKVRFRPKIKEAQFLTRNFKINSMIDISDGLVLDLYRILSESKKQAVLFKDHIPLNPGAKIENALYDGEDYELLFTSPLKNRGTLEKKGFFYIGFIKNSRKAKVSIRNTEGKTLPLKIEGYFCL
ncbi:MAG: thiamine-phosphate kinase [Candidatus Omnitrophica bacterium]|nr:thiamine-phosphate kinase [Candidatus Omnitrophota bacterium]